MSKGGRRGMEGEKRKERDGRRETEGPWPSGRDGDSRSMGPGFKSRRSANFQRLCRTFEIGVHMRHRLPSVNGELRGNCDLTETCFLVHAIIQKAQFVRVGPFPMISEGNNCEVGR